MPHEQYLGSPLDPVYDSLVDAHGGNNWGWMPDILEDPLRRAAGEVVDQLQDSLANILPGQQPWEQMGPHQPKDGWNFGPQMPGFSGEPLGGWASEAAGALVGAGVTAATGNPVLGFGAGVVVENLIEDHIFSGSGGQSSMAPNGGLQPAGNMLIWKKINKQTGLAYGRLLDGRMVYQKKNGTVTVFRPKKPIVLYPGKVTIGQASRASTLLGNYAKRLKKSKFKAFL